MRQRNQGQRQAAAAGDSPEREAAEAAQAQLGRLQQQVGAEGLVSVDFVCV